ncbi:GNAT family N-acetyltransferase [Shewanella ulleungensis]|uniref:Acetyltransferase n=1 Tax=Shewanella ulleungensis TaxID=2282699 RepID=A0ABQ2QVI6_9GAMM|nr:GNAT family N-acetyltransferase [Shewanella ulleungensis]MCL1151357.1 GNAT family N-acetyltransferase [Shewanella ulleungensis]GGP97448.1 acetyltransferase [Shewanella ulleungensis]
MSFIVRKAVLTDAKAITHLERAHVDDELTTPNGILHAHSLTISEVKQLINLHWLVVAEQQGDIIGYVVAAKWAFVSSQPLYRNIIQRIKFAEFEGRPLSTTNTCQYGPIWINQSYRGNGIFEAMVSELKRLIKDRYPFMVTYIAADNARSLAAHQNKAAMHVLEGFSFEQRDYQLLVTETQK